MLHDLLAQATHQTPETVVFTVSSLQWVAALTVMLFGVLFGVWVINLAERRAYAAAKQNAEDLTRNARVQAEQIVKNAELEAKDEYYRQKADFERQVSKKEAVLEKHRQRCRRLESKLERKIEQHDERLGRLAEKDRELDAKAAETAAERDGLAAKKREMTERLETVAGMTAEQARAQVLSELEEELRRESAALARRVEMETQETSEKKARQLLTLAIQKCAAEVVSESTVSTVQLASDDMKARIIGREGRNIRALEAATGVNIIVDETPGAVVLSCYDPLRREIARVSLEKLLADGRIQPARIEEVVEKVDKDMTERLRELGREAFAGLGLMEAHPDVLAMFGRLNYRTSYGQNIMTHSIEVAHLCGALAAELGGDVEAAKRAGLLHDIGKAMPSEIEGTHAMIGAEFCRRLGESAAVVHAIQAHHNEVEPKTIVAVLLQASDAVSASRPGARRESLENYVKRLKQLEALATEFDGVSRSYALQAGRELRVMVEPERLTDDEALLLSREISKKIERELTFPGVIKVTVLRESRFTDFARHSATTDRGDAPPSSPMIRRRDDALDFETYEPGDEVLDEDDNLVRKPSAAAAASTVAETASKPGMEAIKSPSSAELPATNAPRFPRGPNGSGSSSREGSGSREHTPRRGIPTPKGGRR